MSHIHPLLHSPSASPSSSKASRTLPSDGNTKRGQYRVGPHIDPFNGARSSSSAKTEEANLSSRLMRQRFRQRCQDAMARDRLRDRQKRLDGISGRGSSVSDGFSSSPLRGHARSTLMSDDMSDDADAMAQERWTEEGREEEEEMLRRIMLAEYRAMLREQDRQGEKEVGWLGPDELAWLEEEIQRELEQQQSQTVWPNDANDVEPPPDMEDEDEMLCSMYEHSQQGTAQARVRTEGDAKDEDFSWVHDLDLDFDMSEDMDLNS